MRGEPHEWIEPERGEDQLRNELRERVDALDVGHLMHENVAAALICPIVGIVRQ